jgi:hypothetical protein
VLDDSQSTEFRSSREGNHGVLARPSHEDWSPGRHAHSDTRAVTCLEISTWEVTRKENAEYFEGGDGGVTQLDRELERQKAAMSLRSGGW